MLWRNVPMTDKRKKMARALSEKTRMSYQAAINVLDANRTPRRPNVQVVRTLEELLGALHTTTTFTVEVHQAPAVGVSADQEVAREQSRRLAENPQFIAETGQAQIGVTAAEMTLLQEAGAAGPDLQVIRSFKHQFQSTFSAQCATCNRWIWCGEEERAAKCFCGFEYRVTFDAPPDWNLPQDMRCMDCGARFGMAEKKLGLSPWMPINEWQMRCAHCTQFAVHHGNMHVETDERGKPIVRFSHHDRPSIDKFIAENNLLPDWPKAFMSSSGTLNGRRIEFWRVPVTSRAPESAAIQRAIARHQRLCAAEFVVHGVVACDSPATVVLVMDKPVQFKMSDMLVPAGTSDQFNACADHAERMAVTLAREQQGKEPKRFKL